MFFSEGSIGFTRLSEVLLDAEMVKEHCFSGSEVMKGKEQNKSYFVTLVFQSRALYPWHY